MPTNDKPQIGGMKVERLSEYPSGAKRSDTRGKGTFYMISPFGLRRLALRYEEGAVDKGAHNWEKGFPMSRCVDSAMRHLSQIMAGDRSEDHWAAVAWQAFAAMHFEDCISAGSLPASLDDLPNYGSEESPADPEEFPGDTDTSSDPIEHITITSAAGDELEIAVPRGPLFTWLKGQQKHE